MNKQGRGGTVDIIYADDNKLIIENVHPEYVEFPNAYTLKSED